MNLTDSCLYIDHQECFRGIQWDTQSSVYALEVQEPFSQYLLTGQKCIETREYPLPTSLQNCPILLMETTSSTPCTSSLDDSVRFPMHPETKIEPEADMVSVGGKESSGAEETTITATANPNRDEKQHPHIRIIGALVFSRSQVYLSESMWRHDDKYHMVSPNSAYGWSETKKNLAGMSLKYYHLNKPRSISLHFVNRIRVVMLLSMRTRQILVRFVWGKESIDPYLSLTPTSVNYWLSDKCIS